MQNIERPSLLLRLAFPELEFFLYFEHISEILFYSDIKREHNILRIC